MEKATTIVDAVGRDTILLLGVFFIGVLYWAFKPRWDKRNNEQNNDDLNI
ncbi:MAG: hypothetical protein OEW37_06460 [Rhodospirillaceae bacterium]|nr:hypothetical protein [Rhodospirillaceae bacterium]